MIEVGQESVDLLAAIVAVQRDLIADPQPERAYERAIALLVELSDSQFGFIGEVLPATSGTHHFRLKATSGIPSDTPSQVAESLRALEETQPHQLDALAGTFQTFLALRCFGLDGELVGMVGLANRRAGYDDDLTSLLQPVCNAIGLMICSTRRKSLDKTADRQQAEQKLHDVQQRLALILKAADVGLWDWNFATNEVVFSEEWKGQLGYAGDEIANRYEEWESRVHRDDLPPALERIRAALDSPSGEYKSEFRLRHKNGSWRGCWRWGR